MDPASPRPRPPPLDQEPGAKTSKPEEEKGSVVRKFVEELAHISALAISDSALTLLQGHNRIHQRRYKPPKDGKLLCSHISNSHSLGRMKDPVSNSI